MKQTDLTKGNIPLTLIKLALPIMGTSFIQMAYNMTDLIWIGKLGARAAAAVGTAGFFMWFAMGLITIPKIAAEALVSRSVGKKDANTSRVVGTILKLTVIIGLVYSLVILVFRAHLIGFFNLKDAQVVSMSTDYATIIAFSYILFFINPVFSAIFNAYGTSTLPFLINISGLILNMILDPLLIFGVIGKPLGVHGAAIATIISQGLVTLIFLFYIAKNKDLILFRGFQFFRPLNRGYLREILKTGTPTGIQSMSFTVIAMVIARIIARYGFIGITVQKIGSQIEAVTWMTASGFSVAVSAFIGQNLGAQQFERIKKGYRIAYALMAAVGLITTALLVIFPKQIFSIFLTDSAALPEGIVYLTILGYSQFFMCIEIVTNGAFYGLGKTLYPALNSSFFTALRIPFALLFSHFIGLPGIWWAISISSMFKGVIITFLYVKISAPKKSVSFSS